MASASASADNLRQSVEQLMVATRLEQHAKVSELSGQVARSLVEMFDRELQEYGYEGESGASDGGNGEEEDEVDQEKSRILELICNKLRELSELTAIYDEVVEFVHIQVGCWRTVTSRPRKVLLSRRKPESDTN